MPTRDPSRWRSLDVLRAWRCSCWWRTTCRCGPAARSTSASWCCRPRTRPSRGFAPQLLGALLRVAVRHAPALWRAVARAGQRTLVVFAGHFLVRVLLERFGVRGDLDTGRWGMAAWAVTLVICVAACAPTPRRRPAPAPEPIIHRELTTVR